jgi:hypothetical protein
MKDARIQLLSMKHQEPQQMMGLVNIVQIQLLITIGAPVFLLIVQG